jgi:hypothetical protein
MSPDFSPVVIDLIRRCAPSFAAVELLVYLHGHGEREWTAEELCEVLKPRGFTLTGISESLGRFEKCGLVQTPAAGVCRYQPPEGMAEQVKLLVAAYHERPVSLIRVIYNVADDPVQSFADSFRIKPDPS